AGRTGSRCAALLACANRMWGSISGPARGHKQLANNDFLASGEGGRSAPSATAGDKSGASCSNRIRRPPLPPAFPPAMNLVSIPANPVPDDVVTGMVKTRDGVSLRFARWAPPAGRKGTVCLFPGRAEFIEKYFETVRDLRARGFAVAALDWRGQGM